MREKHRISHVVQEVRTSSENHENGPIAVKKCTSVM